MKSSTGVIKRLNPSDIPAQMPNGIPMSSAIATAAMVSASVSMLSCHRPCRPMNNKPHRVSSPTFQLPSTQARKVNSTTTPSQPM